MIPRPDRSPLASGTRGQRIAQTYAELLDRVHRVLGSGPADRVGPMTRVEVDAPPLDLLRWLAAQYRLPRLYWADREDSRRIAGVGFADRLELHDDMTPATLLQRAAGRLRGRDPALRYYGGFRFDPGAPIRAAWRAFGRGWLVMPRFEMVACDGRVRFACNLFPGRDSPERIGDELRLLASNPTDLEAPAGRTTRTDLPTQRDWQHLVESVGAELRSRTLRKIVLARRSDWNFGAPVPPLGLLQRLSEHCGPCFQFCFDPDGESAFVGATPERLFRRSGGLVFSEALAGTRPRGLNGLDDERLRQEMLDSEKEALEHRLVVRHLTSRLNPLADPLVTDPVVSVLRLPRLQHMRTAIRGRLHTDVDDAMLLEALHPTPAVAGDPPARAVARIRTLAPFDRGWYGGPVGYIGAEDSEFAVAIRSALVHGRSVSLFVGAGIVSGSDSADEWRELESKSHAVRSGWADG